MCLNVLQLMEEMRNFLALFEAKEWHCFTLEAGLHPRPSTAKHYTDLIRVGKEFFLSRFIYFHLPFYTRDINGS